MVNGTDYWLYPEVMYDNEEFYMYTTLMPAMLKMYYFNTTNVTEEW